jgi:hypothetical protein
MGLLYLALRKHITYQSGAKFRDTEDLIYSIFYGTTHIDSCLLTCGEISDAKHKNKQCDSCRVIAAPLHHVFRVQHVTSKFQLTISCLQPCRCVIPCTLPCHHLLRTGAASRQLSASCLAYQRCSPSAVSSGRTGEPGLAQSVQ